MKSSLLMTLNKNIYNFILLIQITKALILYKSTLLLLAFSFLNSDDPISFIKDFEQEFILVLTFYLLHSLKLNKDFIRLMANQCDAKLMTLYKSPSLPSLPS